MNSEGNDILSNLYDDNDDSDNSENESNADGLSALGLNDSDLTDMVDSTPDSASQGDSSESGSDPSDQPNTSVSMGNGVTASMHVETSSESASAQSSVASKAGSESASQSSAIEDKVNPSHMDSRGETDNNAVGFRTKSQEAQSKMSSAFTPGIDNERDDINKNGTNVRKASSAMSDYSAKAKKQGLVDDDQIQDMRDFCDNIKQIVVNFSQEYNYDAKKLNQQAMALYDNQDAMKHGGKPDEVKEVQAWIQTGTPQQLSKMTHQMARVVNDPRFKAFLAEDKDSGKTPDTITPQKNIDEKMHDRTKGFVNKQIEKYKKNNQASDSNEKQNRDND